MEWKPIESAPKDGTTVLVGAYGVLGWRCRSAKMANNSYYEKRWYSGQKTNHPLGYEPTHWMPLPNPPTQQGEK